VSREPDDAIRGLWLGLLFGLLVWAVVGLAVYGLVELLS
jgi:hypothetical protein